MRTYWFWPHPNRGVSPLVAASLVDGDAAIVHSLATWHGEPLRGDGDGYRIVRTLPEMAPTERRDARWLLDRFTVRLRRVWQRHRLVARADPDLCYLELLDPVVDVVAVRLLARRRPVVAVVHDVRPHQPWRLRRLHQFLIDATIRSADHLVVFHDVLRDELVRDVGVAPVTVSVVPHPRAVPVEPVVADRSGVPPMVLFFGSMRANKGVDVLLAAAAGLDPACARVHLAGTGSAPVVDLVRRAVDAGEVTAELEFISDVRRDALYREASIVVLPYRDFHAQSGVVADAMAYGIPVVATDVGALGATVSDAGSGLVVAPDDPEAFRAAIERLLGDHELHRRCAAGAREAAARSTPDAVGRQLRAVFAGVLDGR